MKNIHFLFLRKEQGHPLEEKKTPQILTNDDRKRFLHLSLSKYKYFKIWKKNLKNSSGT